MVLVILWGGLFRREHGLPSYDSKSPTTIEMGVRMVDLSLSGCYYAGLARVGALYYLTCILRLCLLSLLFVLSLLTLFPF